MGSHWESLHRVTVWLRFSQLGRDQTEAGAGMDMGRLVRKLLRYWAREGGGLDEGGSSGGGKR